jgi:hypothetical protein
MILRPLPLLGACALLVLSGLVHGIWTERWQSSQALQNACARLADVPINMGAWKSTELEVDEESFQQTRALAYWTRRYVKDGANEPMTVILMCGRANHMSVHTPDICYRGAGFDIVGEQAKTRIGPSQGGFSAELWTARFRPPSKSAVRDLRLYWAWNADGTWQAPASPRWTFGSESFLYKLYVVHETKKGSGLDSVAHDFLGQLLPTLNKSLFSAQAAGS